MSMPIIGLTGGIASGKSTVAQLFAELGAGIIDADQIARDVVALGTPALAQIIQHFSQDVLSADGTLNRQILRQHIFEHPTQRLWLEGLLHPLIRKQMTQQAKRLKTPYGIMIIPLLKNHEDYPILKRVIVVDTPETLQLERLQQRDHSSLTQAQAMLAAQLSRTERLKLADDVIKNNGDITVLKTQVNILHQRYLKL